jgi:hypothetical protein
MHPWRAITSHNSDSFASRFRLRLVSVAVLLVLTFSAVARADFTYTVSNNQVTIT